MVNYGTYQNTTAHEQNCPGAKCNLCDFCTVHPADMQTHLGEHEIRAAMSDILSAVEIMANPAVLSPMSEWVSETDTNTPSPKFSSCETDPEWEEFP